jgi:oxygen-independent coproporphyrinogen-3 oxidase
LNHDIASLPLKQRPDPHAGTVLAAVSRVPPPAASLYIHVPFCFHKCHYCDFYSLVDTRDRQEAFTTRLIAELEALSPWASPLRTIFVGGGTPSLLAPGLWKTLLERLNALFDLSAMRDGSGEFTVECNPETVTPELMHTLKSGGVTRVSVGAQSFNPQHLKTLERWHDPANVPRAVEMARAAGISRQSIDLIFGIPGQSVEDWLSDLRQALALGTEHLSCYALTYEPGTAITARLKRGEFHAIDEDFEADMFGATLDTLRSAGLDRYEVSNFARPGAECRHNLAYWRQESWLAAGPSASAHVGGHRWKNRPRLDDYLNRAISGFSPIIDHEPPDTHRALTERLLTGLRLAEGLDIASTLERAGAIDAGAPARLQSAAAGAVSKGLLNPSASRWTLTDSGFLIADVIVLDFMSALDGPGR